MSKDKIINIAVIAHVDAGKSTLVDAFLQYSGIYRKNQEVIDRVMDSDDIERERGITIYSKNCSIKYKDYKLNIVDTPGHSDFSSEVERVINTVDTVILLVDSIEGPMPQTRFVLQKSLEKGLKPILMINKIDKPNHRADEVVDMTFDLFVDLNANDEQLDFPILYGISKDGIAKHDIDDDSTDIAPLLDTIIEHTNSYPDYDNESLQLQVSTLAYDDYVGRLGIGRVYKGIIREGQTVSVAKSDGTVEVSRISKLMIYEGTKQIEVKEVRSGDIAIVAGLSNISIGDTICEEDKVLPLDSINIEEPTLSMNFLVNNSPFAGLSGKYVTTRHIKDRLERELEVNVGLKVEALDSTDGYKVSGRGELHLSILIENMRREGYELGISKPEVLFQKDKDGKLLEPIERVTVILPEEYSGTAIAKLNLRNGIMQSMEPENGYVKLEYLAPTRGLLGFRSELITDSHGEATILRSFECFDKYTGEIPKRTNGVIISQETGVSVAYSLNNISERGSLFIPAGIDVYEGMIIGMNSRSEDMTVNPCRGKKQSNVRAAGSDDAIKLTPPKIFSLEEALEFIEEDELIEVTPDSIRLRKRILTESGRRKSNK
ncbi:MAG: translational GTPase TypA [Epulopiscium sp.]|nr:translational GTPase TypA [Candidatus Epulonipiscium sp.]